METPTQFTARPHVLQEANYKQQLDLRPNLAVLPWGATEAHNYHLPHGTDNIEAERMGEEAVARANEAGARCVLLPTVPFGIDHSQLGQVATVTMRASTQQAVLRDVAESMVRQSIDRLVVLNFHGGNDFKSMIRDVMFDLPIYIVMINGYEVDPGVDDLIVHKGDHAGEFETSLMLYLTPQWVAPLDQSGDGSATPSKLPAVTGTPGVWAMRDWEALTQSTGVGAVDESSAEKGKQIFDRLVGCLAPVLAELSKAKPGDFPFVIRHK